MDTDRNENDFLPPASEVCEGYVFTGVRLSTGGVHGRGECVAGVCVAGGMHGGGHAWHACPLRQIL